MPPSFLFSAISQPPKITFWISWRRLLDSRTFMKSVRVIFNVPSGDQVRRSRRCCGVMPSGPPEGPAEKLLRFLILSPGEIWRFRNWLLPLNSLGCLRSGGTFGCFCLTLWLQSFFCYPRIGTDNFYKPLPGMDFRFQCLPFGTDFFSLVLMFPGVRIEASPPSTVQGKCIYTFFKVKNQAIQFLLLCTKPSKDKHKILSFKGQ